MYRIKVISKVAPNTYRWYNNAKTAHLIAYTIIKNKDADAVEVENLKEKKIEKIYKKS